MTLPKKGWAKGVTRAEGRDVRLCDCGKAQVWLYGRWRCPECDDPRNDDPYADPNADLWEMLRSDD